MIGFFQMIGKSRSITNCPICGSKSLHYAFMLNGQRMVECDECDFLMMNPLPLNDQKSTQNIKKNIVSNTFAESQSNDCQRVESGIIIQSLENLLRSQGLHLDGNCDRDILYVGIFGQSFCADLQKSGLNFNRIQLIDVNLQENYQGAESLHSKSITLDVFQSRHKDYLEQFDIVIIDSHLMRVDRPKEFLKLFWDALKVGGSIFCLLPYFDSSSVKDRSDSLQPEWNYLSYFNLIHLDSILFQAGFSNITAYKIEKYSGSPNVRKDVMEFMHPRIKQNRSYVCASAEKIKSSDSLVLSVVMPAFNEVETIVEGIQRVLDKKIPGIDIELILIESNSSDGTREKVMSFSSDPRVKIILEDAPKGKGHAVRAGFKNAIGDFVLIQDADDEYDIEDYDALLEPLRDGRQKFVLGARHGSGGWKMRRFDDQPFRAFILNCGHWGFTFLINATCFVWLKDPFTMYKVFRRDCLRGLPLECNRFDFDHELVIKLIRKGFRPIEIPVNYRSRSFLQGKKVRVFADPLTWLKAIIKYRFQKI